MHAHTTNRVFIAAISTNFSQLNLGKLLKLSPPCVTKFSFGWASDTDPAGGAYSIPRPLKLDLRGPTSKAGKGRERGGERRGRERDRKERKERG